MILSARTIPPLALLVALATVAVVFELGIGAAPEAFFGAGEVAIIGPPAGEIPGRAIVSAWMVDALGTLDAVRGVSPEVYVLAEIDGASVLARGVEMTAFMEMEGARVVEGRAPTEPGEAMVGRGLAAIAGHELGDNVLLPSTFERLALPFEIVGIFDAESPVRDELVVTLDAARALASVPADSAHVIRVRTSDPREFARLAGVVEPTFTVSQLRLSATSLLVGEPAFATVRVTNWGVLPGAHHLEVRQDGAVRGQTDAIVAGRTSLDVTIPFTLAEGSPVVSVNPSATVELREPRLNVTLVGDRVAAGEPFRVLVETEGAALPGVRVTAGDSSGTTDAHGLVELVAPEAQVVLVYAARASAAEGFLEIPLSPPGSSSRSVPVLREIRLGDPLLGEHQPVVVLAEVQNLGGVPGTAEIDLRLGERSLARAAIPLAPGERVPLRLEAAPLGAGRHTLELDPGDHRLDVRVYPGRDPRVALILEQGESRAAPPPAAAAASPADYVGLLLGNVAVAVAMLSIVSSALAALGVVALLARHLRERLVVTGALKAIGASDRTVLVIALKDALVVGVAAAVSGVAAGLGVAVLLERSGLVRAFGHGVSVVAPTHVLVTLAFASALLVVVASQVIVSSALRTNAADLLAGSGGAPSGEAPDLARALGED